MLKADVPYGGKEHRARTVHARLAKLHASAQQLSCLVPVMVAADVWLPWIRSFLNCLQLLGHMKLIMSTGSKS